MEVAEIWFLRQMNGVARLDRIMNEWGDSQEDKWDRSWGKLRKR